MFPFFVPEQAGDSAFLATRHLLHIFMCNSSGEIYFTSDHSIPLIGSE